VSTDEQRVHHGGEHRHDDEPRGWRAHAALLRTRGGRVLGGAVLALALATLVGLVALWPGEAAPAEGAFAYGGAPVGAEVVRPLAVECPGPARQRCLDVVLDVEGGPTDLRLSLGPRELVADLQAGERVRVQRIEPPAGSGGEVQYAFAGLERRGALLWLAVAFAVLVVVMARLRGLLALAGFGLSLLLIVEFVVPAILAGSSALLVALVGALAVMFVTVLLTYGLTAQSAAAALGIAATLALATAVGAIAAGAAGLDGREGEFAGVLAQTAAGVSLEGIVLAGLVLGALGVLADMGVTQASAVMAVRRANPQLSARRLYREGFAVGRDHVVATTHTLMLAYAGATLPLLVVLRAGGAPTGDALNLQDLAEPIVATLVGAMALLASVPITTALAAAVVSRIPAGALPESDHGHAH
jgi:uncharacterized membrane protein